ncbi:hypothetical protein [Cohnella abietis]|uniref:Uncharacterized protein n=1 Tax=Cohnella abietis TaxID=2507935 RepID=A0A3T1D8F3_9BACL|nr:hypothetical protein [Cohnella abietis]BBI34335.1 hypothetical protein KCTCHS21_37340 [Cohnella abietis]
MINIDIETKCFNMNNRLVSIAFVDQRSIGIENSVFLETQINIYGDSKSLYILGALFNLIQKEKSIIVYLQRSSNKASDIVLFHGTSNPITYSDCVNLRKKAYKVKTNKKYSLEINEETKADKLYESWKFKDLYSIRSNGQLILMSCNLLGLRLAELICKSLIDTNDGHTHFDDMSTKESLELIIRNKDTDMIFQ